MKGSQEEVTKPPKKLRLKEQSIGRRRRTTRGICSKGLTVGGRKRYRRKLGRGTRPLLKKK